MRRLRISSPWLFAASAVLVTGNIAGCPNPTDTSPADTADTAGTSAQSADNRTAAPADNDTRSYKVTVDATVRPFVDSVPNDDGQPRPVAALTDKSGIPAAFVENELIVSTSDAAALDALLKRWNGTIVKKVTPEDYGFAMDPIYAIRVQTEEADASQLANDLGRLNADKNRNDVRVSSEAGRNLVAIAAGEAVDGMSIGLNFVHEPTGFRERDTREGAMASRVLTSSDGSYRENWNPDPFQWSYFRAGGAQNFGVAEAWRVLDWGNRLGNKVGICVIDGGFADGSDYPDDRRHYTGSVWAMDPTRANDVQCTGGSSCPWHGINVVETCMGKAGNGYGAAGPAGPVARAITIRRSNDVINNIDAILTAAFSGANIINMSFGARVPASLSWSVLPFDAVTARARGAGKLLFAAAGNDNEDIDEEDCFIVCWEAAWHTPAENSGVIAVGAMEANSRVCWPQSNYGAHELDIWGPGYVWVGPDPANQQVHVFNATSAATPFVSGVAALIWAANPGLGADGVERILMETCNQGGPGEVQNWPNAYAAVVKAIGDTPPELTIKPAIIQPVFVGPPTVQLEAIATDKEDGVPRVQWFSDRDGLLGEGLTLLKGGMSLGHHNITAVARDAFGLEVRQTTAIDIYNNPPRVEVDSPADGMHFFPGQRIYLAAWTYDYDGAGALSDSAIRWRSNLDGDLGAGANRQVTLRTIGRHTITLSGADPFGATGTATISLVVDTPPADIPPTAQILRFDYDPISWVTHYDADFDAYWFEVSAGANAYDPESGDLRGAALQWHVEGDGVQYVVYGPNFPCQCGELVVIRIYCPRRMDSTVVLTATDPGGQSVVVRRTVTMNAPLH